MRSLLSVLVILTGAILRADLTTTKSIEDRGENGIVATTVTKRDGLVVYVRHQHDPKRSGDYQNCVERFYIRGMLVAEVCEWDGKRSIDVRSDKDIDVSFFSGDGAWKPKLIVAEMKGVDTEFYFLRSDEFFQPTDTEEKVKLTKQRMHQKDSPNQPPLRMPVSGTPAASASAKATADRGAAVAPPPGGAGR